MGPHVVTKEKFLSLIGEKDILCFSVQHTGTWFVLRFLAKHPETNGISIGVERLTPDDSRRIFHAHLPGMGVGNEPDRKGLLQELARSYPVVIPMRDPVRAFFTKNKRAKDPDVACPGRLKQAEAFLWLPDLEGVHFMPVDCPPERRQAVLEECLAFCGLSPAAYVQDHAARWGVENTTNRTLPEEQAYIHGDIRPAMQTNGDAIGMLLKQREKLIPWMKSLGYKDLAWWTKS